MEKFFEKLVSEVRANPQGTALCLVLLLVTLWFTSSPGGGGEKKKKNEAKKNAPLPPLTVEEVAKHSTEQDGWVIIDDQVYDVTEYNHPGGDAINRWLGRDASKPFKGTQHGPDVKDMLGTPMLPCLGPLVK